MCLIDVNELYILVHSIFTRSLLFYGLTTAINGREKAAKKVKQVKVPQKRGKLAKGEERAPAEPKRLDIQL